MYSHGLKMDNIIARRGRHPVVCFSDLVPVGFFSSLTSSNMFCKECALIGLKHKLPLQQCSPMCFAKIKLNCRRNVLNKKTISKYSRSFHNPNTATFIVLERKSLSFNNKLLYCFRKNIFLLQAPCCPQTHFPHHLKFFVEVGS